MERPFLSLRLLVDLSSHGFGHVAQAAPVVNRLRRRYPALEVLVRGRFPPALLASRFTFPIRVLDEPSGAEFQMSSALDVLPRETAEAFRALHAEWETRVERAARELAEMRVDLLLSDVPYLGLAGAKRAGIPAVALSSLCWAHVFRHYCEAYAGAAAIHAQMLAAYRGADAFLRVAPGMPLPGLDNVQDLGPVAEVGQRRGDALRGALGIGAGTRIVLFALGGIATDLPLVDWPQVPGVHWLTPAHWKVTRGDSRDFPVPGFTFLDLLASCDAVITKPGYGTFVEAACNGVPVLTVPRADWPEYSCLADWLGRHGRMAEVSREALWAGQVAPALDTLLAGSPPTPVAPTGVDEAAEALAAYLGG